VGRWKLSGTNGHYNSPEETPGWGVVPEQEHGTKALFVKGKRGRLEAFSVSRQECVHDRDGNPEDRHMAASTDLRKPLSAITWGKGRLLLPLFGLLLRIQLMAVCWWKN